MRLPRHHERGFTLIEVMVTLMILGFSMVGLQASLGTAVDLAIATKSQRQARSLLSYQMGQVSVGVLTPDEEDPFPDGQTGHFEDVGGYAEEYAVFEWSIRKEEVSICGGDETSMQDAGFVPGEDGKLTRPVDTYRAQAAANRAAGARADAGVDGGREEEELETPEGQFKQRVILTVTYRPGSIELDRTFSLITYLPLPDEAASFADQQAARSSAQGGANGAAGNNGAPSSGAAGSPNAGGTDKR